MHSESYDFLLFAGEAYYPSGGWWDYQGAFGSLEEAKAAIGKNERGEDPDWWHIIDANSKKCVAHYGGSLYGHGSP